MSQLPPYRSLPSRFCTAAVLILIGVVALRWAWDEARRIVVPVSLAAVAFIVWRIAAWRRRDDW